MARPHVVLVLATAVLGWLCAVASAQNQNTTITNTGGVWIDTDGVVQARQADVTQELTRMRDLARRADQLSKGQRLCYISLPKLLNEVRELTQAGRPIPDELRFLGGVVQLRYVFVYPEQHDLIIAGPAEPWDATNAIQPFGKLTGRPVLQLDDLVLALRLSGALGNGGFGCSIDPPADALNKALEVQKRAAGRSQAELMQELTKALGPQKVTVFGAAADTRTAFVCVAADYRIKRLCLGADPSPVAGVGNAMDSSRAAGERVWFEASYEPLLVSPDGNAYEIRGQRLQLKAGALQFDPKGATPGGIAFAKRFTEKMPALAAAVPLFADLQNIADLSLLAALIRQDKLDAKVGWDWAKDAAGYKLMSVPVPHTAATLAGSTSGSIMAGGVSLTPAPLVAQNNRAPDNTGALTAPRQQAAPAEGAGAVRYAGPTSQPAVR